MTTSLAIDRPVAHWWERYKRVLLVIGIVLLGAVIVAALTSGSERGYLHPDGVDDVGARALVRILGDQGVTVIDVRTADAAVDAATTDTTMLITDPDLLRPGQIQNLTATGADVVAIAPSATVGELSDRISTAGVTRPSSHEPDCAVAAAERAGSARTGGISYTIEDPAVACFPVDGRATLVEDRLDGGGRLIILGTPAALMNRYLDEDGNAALALGLLGQHPELIWYRPTLEGIGEEPAALTDLLPGWVEPLAWQLAIAALLAAYWRGRRLGRLVTEPLPVVVRAAETTEGRARLYRRGRAVDHAGATLQSAAVDRLRTRLGLPRDADPVAVTDAVASRTGRSEASVRQLLFGAQPASDADLVRLATDLDSLEQEVRSL
jgi:hypothetical protein